MQISCSICQELIHASQNPLFIPCGHIYHEECLSRWLQQKKSCPQCRTSVRCQPAKVYFNVNEQEGLNESIGDRLAASENECFELQTKNKCLDESLSQHQHKLEKAHNKIIELEGRISDDKCIIASCRMQIEQLKADNVKVTELKRRLESAEKELETLSSLKVILQGTEEEVSERMSNYQCNEKSIRQLCLHVETLKRQSEKYQKRCKDLIEKQKPQDIEVSELRRNRLKLQERIDELNKIMAATKNKSGTSRSPDYTEKRDRSVIDVSDDSFDDILKENFKLPGGKEMKFLSATEHERLKRKGKETRDGGPLEKRLMQQPTTSGDFVYDGMGGSVRASSIVVKMTKEEKGLAYAAAEAKERAARSRKILARSAQSRSMASSVPSSSIRSFLTACPEPTAPSADSMDYIELD